MTARPLPPLLLRGDCIARMRDLPDASIDAVVTDPPYGLDFMGKAWDRYTPLDFEQWCASWAAEALRVLKPGGHLLAFGGSRTWHRLAAGIEDAGFEIRDSIAWIYGSGFPKSLDVSKAIDKAAGAEREVVGFTQGRSTPIHEGGQSTGRPDPITTPATPEAAAWQGWGTALKPAFEPIVVARKPLAGTVAANVLQYGTGALNIDASRIGSEVLPAVTRGVSRLGTFEGADGNETSERAGRWPANVMLDESQAAALDAQTGTLKSGVGQVGAGKGVAENASSYASTGRIASSYGDTGGASRFFYVAKAPKSERPVYWRPSCNCETIKPCHEDGSPRRATEGSRSTVAPCSSMSTSGSESTADESRQGTTSTTSTATSSTTTPETSSSSQSSNTSASIPGASFETGSGGSLAESVENSSQSPLNIGTSAPKAGRSMAAADPATLSGWSETSVCANCGAPARREQHATVKPLALMRYLCKLVTPPGGVVLDPFAGSGTTLEAAYSCGFEAIEVELTPDYWPLIEARIERAVAARQKGADRVSR